MKGAESSEERKEKRKMKTYLVKGRDPLGEWMEEVIKANDTCEASNIFSREFCGRFLVIIEIA
jgi:hypothetical protein